MMCKKVRYHPTYVHYDRTTILFCGIDANHRSLGLIVIIVSERP